MHEGYRVQLPESNLIIHTKNKTIWMVTPSTGPTIVLYFENKEMF